jgi:hypothetical protein
MVVFGMFAPFCCWNNLASPLQRTRMEKTAGLTAEFVVNEMAEQNESIPEIRSASQQMNAVIERGVGVEQAESRLQIAVIGGHVL